MNDHEKFLRKNIGRKIKLARAKANFTQEQLAEKTSLSTRYISQLERGIAFGSATTITNICKTLNVNPSFLFEDSIDENSSNLHDVMDDKFLTNYLKLNNYNRAILNSMANELVRLQECNAAEYKKA